MVTHRGLPINGRLTVHDLHIPHLFTDRFLDDAVVKDQVGVGAGAAHSPRPYARNVGDRAWYLIVQKNLPAKARLAPSLSGALSVHTSAPMGTAMTISHMAFLLFQFFSIRMYHKQHPLFNRYLSMFVCEHITHPAWFPEGELFSF
jgi:hypothetical protein